MKNNPLSFLRRYWAILLLFIASLTVSTTDLAFGVVGTLVYLPVLAFGSVITALGIRHLFFKQTLDEDAHSGYFVTVWRGLTPLQRVYLNLGTMVALFWGVCWIAAALIK